ncbi:MAG TPA: MFS transporter [Microbacterium sp.]|nr:MFS transporter [Microbacterium sp.]
MTSEPASTAAPARPAPLYAAGFVTAVGAFSVAAGLGATGEDIGLSLLRIGVLLALYDIAEVLLKPLFGALSDRIGAKPVIVAGLLAFAALSLFGLGAENAVMLAVARLGQGAAAAAFSPAASASVARLAGPGRTGRFFGRYGSWKSLGYTLGPLLAALLIGAGGMPLLFAVLAGMAAATAVWVAVALPSIPPLARPRYTVIDLVKQTTDRRFLVPTIALATSTAVLGASVGFLPALAVDEGANLVAAIGIASVLALASALVQPWAGSFRDRRTVSDRAGTVVGLGSLATGVLIAAAPWGPAGLYAAAVAIGAGIGVVTPYAFAALADSTPPERMGRTMGSAELGRELGDSVGPLLVGAVATVATLSAGLATLAIVAAAVAAGVGITPASPSARPAPVGTE